MGIIDKQRLLLLVEDEDGRARKVLDRDGFDVDLLRIDLHFPEGQRRVMAALREAVDHYYNS